MEISRLPSHGFFVGSPPKLQGQEILQLQLSATVAVRCQFASAARGGALSAASAMTTAVSNVRMGAMLASPGREAGIQNLAGRPRRQRQFPGNVRLHGLRL